MPIDPETKAELDRICRIGDETAKVVKELRDRLSAPPPPPPEPPKPPPAPPKNPDFFEYL